MAGNIVYIWKDRKRYFGMPISFTRYALSEDRLFLSQGFLNIKDDEILLYRVRDIDTSRNLWQRLFGVGTVVALFVVAVFSKWIIKLFYHAVSKKEAFFKLNREDAE